MALKVEKYSVDKANILPSGKAAVALAEGDLVYLNSSGQWALAVATDPNTAAASRTDAVGIIAYAALQYETVSPVRVAHISGASGTVGQRAYLSATGTTGNTITATKPTQVIVQEIGIYRSSTEIEVSVQPSGMFLQAGVSIGANASVVGSAPVLSASKTGVFKVYAEDGGVVATGAVRAIQGRILLAGAHASGDFSAFGVQGQVKITASVGSIGHKAGVWAYCEFADDAAAIASASCAGLYAMLDVPTAASIASGVYAAAIEISSNSLAGTHTGKAVCIHIPNPVAGTWDALLHVKKESGATGTTYGAIDANKCLLVYYDDTLMKVPLYAAS